MVFVPFVVECFTLALIRFPSALRYRGLRFPRWQAVAIDTEGGTDRIPAEIKRAPKRPDQPLLAGRERIEA